MTQRQQEKLTPVSVELSGKPPESLVESSAKAQEISVEPLPGMRDLHPHDMESVRLINDGIDKVAEQFAYGEYQLPVLERLATYSHQAEGELIAEQAYTFTDRGGRDVLLRPEITPSLARMAVRESGAYRFPLRWYTIANCYRYEKPQKGRLREFAQLNMDIIGDESTGSDLEIFQLIHALMEQFGVPPSKYRIRYNHRGLLNALLRLHDFSEAEKKRFYALMDKCEKLGGAESPAFREALTKAFGPASGEASELVNGDTSQVNSANPNFAAKMNFVETYARCTESHALLHQGSPLWKKLNNEEQAVIEDFYALENDLKNSGLASEPVFDPGIVRGLEYYTGIVFEVFATSPSKINRALIGGGRYDDLALRYQQKTNKASRKLNGVGLGMGTHIFSLFLDELNLLPDAEEKAKSAPKRIYIGPVSADARSLAWQAANKLRQTEWTFYMGRQIARKKHLDRAYKENCSHILLIDENEISGGAALMVENLQSREKVSLDDLLRKDAKC